MQYMSIPVYKLHVKLNTGESRQVDNVVVLHPFAPSGMGVITATENSANGLATLQHSHVYYGVESAELIEYEDVSTAVSSDDIPF